jgi:hypothetical protein
MKKEHISEEAKQRAKNYMSLKGALEPKQETLEEAAEINYKKLYEGEPLTQDVPIDAFIEGAKWQQEKSYNELDMKSFGDWCRNGLLNTEYGVEKLDEHLEQWKQLKKK